MPIEDHPCFQQPDVHTKLRRHMNLAKFISLITSKQLWFANAEVLASEDPYEAMLPKPNYRHRKWVSLADVSAEDIHAIRTRGVVLNGDEDVLQETRRRDAGIRQTFALRKSFFLNCWNAADHESAAMWRLYSNEGIAIVTTFERLKLATSHCPMALYSGTVEYLDYDVDQVDTSNVFNPVVRKRRSFDFENEVRLVYWDNSVSHVSGGKVGAPIGRNRSIEELEALPVIPGHAIAVDIRQLIDEVVLSPTTEDWLVTSVSAICKKVKLDAPVYKSTLLDAPSR